MQACAALVRASGAVDELLARAGAAGTSSRLQLHLQGIALIDDVFTRLLPPPAPRTAAPDSLAVQQCPWSGGAGGVLSQAQKVALQRVHALMLTYATLWQYIDVPTRPHDAQRMLTAMCAMCIFDAVARRRAVDQSLPFSELLWQV